MLMSLGALCVFIWGVLSGAFHGADEASVRFYEMEMESDANRTTTPSKPTSDGASHEDELEEYGGGAIEARHGYLPIWLLVVYCGAFHLGALLHLPLLGRARAGTDSRSHLKAESRSSEEGERKCWQRGSFWGSRF